MRVVPDREPARPTSPSSRSTDGLTTCRSRPPVAGFRPDRVARRAPPDELASPRRPIREAPRARPGCAPSDPPIVPVTAIRTGSRSPGFEDAGRGRAVDERPDPRGAPLGWRDQRPVRRPARDRRASASTAIIREARSTGSRMRDAIAVAVASQRRGDRRGPRRDRGRRDAIASGHAGSLRGSRRRPRLQARRSGRRRIEPLDVRLGAEPRPLALRERRVAAGVLGDRRLARQLAVEDRPRLAVADRRERRQGRDRTARGATRASSTRPASNWARARLRDPVAVRRRVDLEPDPGDRPVVAARRGQRPARRRRPSAISRARTTRRGLAVSIAAARFGATARSRSTSGSSPTARNSASSRARTAGSDGSASVGEPARDRAEVQPGAAGEDRDPAAARRSRPAPRRAWAAKSATVNGSSGSTRSRPWCGMPRRSAERRLRGPDVEAAIDLARVGGDDLGRRSPPPPGAPRRRSRARSCRSRSRRR